MATAETARATMGAAGLVGRVVTSKSGIRSRRSGTVIEGERSTDDLRAMPGGRIASYSGVGEGYGKARADNDLRENMGVRCSSFAPMRRSNVSVAEGTKAPRHGGTKGRQGTIHFSKSSTQGLNALGGRDRRPPEGGTPNCSSIYRRILGNLLG